MLKVLLAAGESQETVAALLRGQNLERLAGKTTTAAKLAARNSFDLIILEDGMKLLPSLKAVDPRAEVILIGRDEADALKAVRKGAAAYFKRPLDPVRFKETIRKIEETVHRRRETGELEKRLLNQYTFAGVTGRNPQMLEILSFLTRIAPYYKTALITGETGTGKEVLAKALHASSPWARHPFVVCNCGSLVEALIESEWFGHLKGSFTGADRDKAGLFEAAGEGTLFLDEIGELSPAFQPRLLRVLQNGEFRKVGSTATVRARCRIIAATHRNLELEVKEGRFREDLFFRITPLTIHLPPLRDRKDDLPLLCRVLLDRFRKRTGKNVQGISRPAQAVLMAHAWPGNVRELENVLEQAAILTPESFIRLEDLPEGLRRRPADSPAAIPLGLAQLEKDHIEKVMRQFDQNQTRAAAALGISRRALLRKLEKWGFKA